MPVTKKLKTVSLSTLIPYENNTKIHAENVEEIAKSIQRNEYITPIIVDEDFVILAGHGRKLALEKGFSLSTGYGGNRSYNIDRNEDSIVQQNSRGSASYHHCIRHVVTNEANNVLIPDNYPQRASNIYRNPEIDKKILESGNYFARGYFYFQKTTIPMANLPEHISKDEATSPETREIIIARENEISAWLDKGGDPAQLYKDYTGEYAITRMLIDLKWVRSK